MPSGRHRASSPVERLLRRFRWRVSRRAAVAALTVPVVIAGGAVLYVRGTGGACSPRDPLIVRVAAAVDIAPPVMEAADRFNATDTGVDGRCVKVQVVEQPPAPVLRTLIGDRVGVLPERPDGWITDSSVWVRLARKQGARNLGADETVVATSPLVFATRRSLAERFAAGKTEMSWDMVFPATARGRLRPTESEPDVVRVPDPSVSGAGIATVAAARDLVGTGSEANKALTAFVRMAQAGAMPDYRTMLEAVYARGFWSRPVVIVPEQSVWAHNRGPVTEPVVALQPKEGTIHLDYPYVVTSDDPAKAKGAELFARWLRSAPVQDLLRRAGFRSADGSQAPFEPGGEIPTRAPKVLPSITPQLIDEALEAWGKLAPPSRILVLADVSEEGARPIGPDGQTRLGVAVKAAKLGLELFPNETHMGLWEFARGIAKGKDHRELISVGSISEPAHGQEIRRTEMLRVADSVRPLAGKSASLYDTILAGFRSLSAGYEPMMSNALLVLTYGQDDGRGISRQELAEALRKEWNPDRPVQIVVVMFGAGRDRAALEEAAAITNGEVYVARQPGEIIDVFLSAIARRLCHPTCPRQ
ncbi:substrate-binding and VWA domain-containing protein [Thermobispora bispora]|uniref:von Willebrand factor type A n=1 Tax=Thermobispora bispora (strain ATCC 19993 / DSM 43833 / CBS 139.67 / JCM 10125 / KCTC 9307 / NBRC 14880 / R51) TaxID=469371 RepID=D6Y5X6_THEBD|nr:substrate-binding and VWA domain-containing protein [Thermobispora bispora]ADG87472.1 hypothetical protein Tbis_0747 [Thermobispora bispora DSM 43833]